MLVNLTIGIVFLIICTYFCINICSNKGKMTDIEFMIAMFMLLLILGFIMTKGQFLSQTGSKGTFLEHFEQKKLRERVVDYTKITSARVADVLGKYKPVAAEFYKDLKNAVKNKNITEKFLL